MATLSVGTFDLNNLFSRFNYAGVVQEARSGEPDIAVEISFDVPRGETLVVPDVRDAEVRTYRGRLIEAKDRRDTEKVAERLAAADADVWALQEVEGPADAAAFRGRARAGRALPAPGPGGGK